VKGLGIYAGLEPISVKGATGWLDTNYAGKVAQGLKALRRHDFVYVHVEAPDEAGHSGVVADKIRAIEDFDARVVGPFVQGLAEFQPYRLLIACDHYTPLAVKTHTREKVPVLIYDSRRQLGRAEAFSEAQADQGPDLSPGHGLLDILLERV
ncbi:MAG: phosphoglycerate mutase, partial [Deltaproteobacteria bacterium]|nr:phosphoglycerate mutase [Deltaproteobacteria bacterium]